MLRQEKQNSTSQTETDPRVPTYIDFPDKIVFIAWTTTKYWLVVIGISLLWGVATLGSELSLLNIVMGSLITTFLLLLAIGLPVLMLSFFAVILFSGFLQIGKVSITPPVYGSMSGAALATLATYYLFPGPIITSDAIMHIDILAGVMTVLLIITGAIGGWHGGLRDTKTTIRSSWPEIIKKSPSGCKSEYLKPLQIWMDHRIRFSMQSILVGMTIFSVLMILLTSLQFPFLDAAGRMLFGLFLYLGTMAICYHKPLRNGTTFEYLAPNKSMLPSRIKIEFKEAGANKIVASFHRPETSTCSNKNQAQPNLDLFK